MSRGAGAPIPSSPPFSQEEKGVSSLLSPLGREVGSEGWGMRPAKDAGPPTQLLMNCESVSEAAAGI